MWVQLSSRIRREGEDSDEETKIYQPPRSYQLRSPGYEKKPPPENNFKSFSSSSWRQNSSSKNPNPSSPRLQPKENAKIADDSSEYDSTDEVDEFEGLSWEQRRKIPFSAWAADSGCTTPMTDSKLLFSSPMMPCRRQIHVGGGFLYSVGIGTAMLKLGDVKLLPMFQEHYYLVEKTNSWPLEEKVFLWVTTMRLVRNTVSIHQIYIQKSHRAMLSSSRLYQVKTSLITDFGQSSQMANLKKMMEPTMLQQF